MSITRSILKFHIFRCQGLGCEGRFPRFRLISFNRWRGCPFRRFSSCTLWCCRGHDGFSRGRRRWVRHGWINVILRIDIDRVTHWWVDCSIRTVCVVRSPTCHLPSRGSRRFGFVGRCNCLGEAEYCVIAIRNYLKNLSHMSFSH